MQEQTGRWSYLKLALFYPIIKKNNLKKEQKNIRFSVSLKKKKYRINIDRYHTK